MNWNRFCLFWLCLWLFFDRISRTDGLNEPTSSHNTQSDIPTTHTISEVCTFTSVTNSPTLLICLILDLHYHCYSCLTSLLVRSSQTLLEVYTHTKRYCSFTQYGLLFTVVSIWSFVLLIATLYDHMFMYVGVVSKSRSSTGNRNMAAQQRIFN